MRMVALLAALFMLIAAAASAAPQQQIGSWLLTCPDRAASAEPCLLRAGQRLLDKGGITGDLEILAEDKLLVPVITLRGLSTDLLLAASLAGRIDASMQFGKGPKEPLECAVSPLGYLCSPRGNAARTLAAGLPAVRSVTVRVSVTMTGMQPMPVQEKSLDLSGTSEALARLRIASPSQRPGPMAAVASQSPAELMAMADKVLKAAGYPNGIADLQALLARYRGK